MFVKSVLVIAAALVSFAGQANASYSEEIGSFKIMKDTRDEVQFEQWVVSMPETCGVRGIQFELAMPARLVVKGLTVVYANGATENFHQWSKVGWNKKSAWYRLSNNGCVTALVLTGKAKLSNTLSGMTVNIFGLR